MNDYVKGFKDGFAVGLEEGKKLVEEQCRQEKIAELEKTLPKPPNWQYTTPGIAYTDNKCPKCGVRINDVSGFVCSSPNCPTYIQTTC